MHLGPAAEAHVLLGALHEGVRQGVLQPLLVGGCSSTFGVSQRGDIGAGAGTQDAQRSSWKHHT